MRDSPSRTHAVSAQYRATALQAALDEELYLHGTIFVHKDVGAWIAS